MYRRIFLGLLALLSLYSALSAQDKPLSREELLRVGIAKLLELQDDGAWPYEGVYRVGGQIPVGYRVGGTALTAEVLLAAAPENKDAQKAVAKGLAYVLKLLDDPLMEASTQDGYDVRVWGHTCTLGFLCRVRESKTAGEHAKAVDEWISKLVKTLITEEISGGGWNYASRRSQASFVTSPVVQSLLLARSQGEKIPDEVFERARKVLEAARTRENAFVYSGDNTNTSASGKPAGACARTPVCEVTLALLGADSTENVQRGLNMFFEHWDELEKRRQKTGTHEGPFLIAPYYFYYGHRYAAQAIEMLPEKARAAEREKLLKLILKTRNDDGTWNDRVFPRSRAYCTSMVLAALLADQMPKPPGLK